MKQKKEKLNLKHLTSVKDLIIGLLLVILSLLVRFWNFYLIPGYRTDEVGEELRAFAIYLGKMFPLTNNAPFIGAFYNYLIAAVFYLLEPDMVVARLVVVIFGSLTPVLVYILGKKLANRTIGIISGLLLCFSPGHILIASHVAWSASLAPFFAVLSIILFIKALESENKKYWLLYGLLTGLAIQIHPSTIVTTFLGPLLYLLLKRKKEIVRYIISIRSLMFILGFFVGYSNMLLFNIIKPLGGVTSMFVAKWTGFSHPLTIGEYFRRLSFLLSEFVTMLCSGVPIISLMVLIKKPVFYIYLIAFITAILISLRRRKDYDILLLLIIFPSLLILAVATRGVMTPTPWGFAWGPHYLQQLLPFTFILMSSVIYSPLAIIHEFKSALSKIFPVLLTIISIGLILIWPFTNLTAFYGFCMSRGINNKPLNDTASLFKKIESECVFVDPEAFQAFLLARVIQLKGVEAFSVPRKKIPAVKALYGVIIKTRCRTLHLIMPPKKGIKEYRGLLIHFRFRLENKYLIRDSVGRLVYVILEFRR